MPEKEDCFPPTHSQRVGVADMGGLGEMGRWGDGMGRCRDKGALRSKVRSGDRVGMEAGRGDVT